jgi:hypothetical protein
VAEPPELHRLKYASPLPRAPTYFKRCNPLGFTSLGLYELSTALTNPTHVCKFICWLNFILKTLFLRVFVIVMVNLQL